MTRKIFEEKIKSKAKSVKIIGDNLKDKNGIYYSVYYNKRVISAVAKYENKRYKLVIKNVAWIEFKTEKEMYKFLNKAIFKSNDVQLVNTRRHRYELTFPALIIIILLIVIFFKYYF